MTLDKVYMESHKTLGGIDDHCRGINSHTSSLCEKVIASAMKRRLPLLILEWGALTIIIEVINADAIDTVDPGEGSMIIIEVIDAEAINTVDPGGVINDCCREDQQSTFG